MRILLALALMASPLLAQDNRGQDFMVNRLKDRLNLSDDQAAKLKEIFSKDGEERSKMDEARTEKINAILNDEQKKQYEELRTRGNRGFGGGGFGGAPGGGRAMGSVNVEDVKRELGLTDEQIEKIKPLYDEFNANIQKRAAELSQKGFQGLNIAEEMQKYQESLKALAEKVKVHLTDEQKTKLDALVERATGMMKLIPNLLNRGGSVATPRRVSPEERANRAVDALKLEKEEEKAALTVLVLKIVKAQDDLEVYLKTARERMSEAAKNHDLSDAAVEDRIKETQAERLKREKDLVGLQKELSEVVTLRQELELLAQGILN